MLVRLRSDRQATLLRRPQHPRCHTLDMSDVAGETALSAQQDDGGVEHERQPELVTKLL